MFVVLDVIPENPWYGPYTSLWEPDQCTFRGVTKNKNVEKCKEKCSAESDCNAFNVIGEKYQKICIFYDCDDPFPNPEATREGWVGYSKKEVTQGI